MKKGRSAQPKDWREARRFRAWDLYQKGWKQSHIAEALGVTQGAVSQWLKQAREGGIETLRARKAPGPKSRLTSEQRARIPDLLKRGAEAFGFRGEIWTNSRVAVVIWREFGVRYHRDHVGRILKGCGWSVQKPIRRASQRDEEAIERWRKERWPEVKKSDRRKADSHLGGRIGILPVAGSSANLRPRRPDTHHPLVSVP